MKKFIEQLHLRLSDLFLLIGFICFAVFLIFGQEFMQQTDPHVVALPLGAAIPLVIIMVGTLGYYLSLEVYKSKEKVNLIIPSIIGALVILGILAIAVQPEHSFENVTVRMDYGEYVIGDNIVVGLYVSPIHKFIFIAELIGIGLMFYIGLFIFPKRIGSVKFIEYLGFALFGLIAVMFVYSYIAEFNNYISIFKGLLGIDKTYSFKELSDIFAVKSFVIHKNAFGMICLLGIVFCFINQSIRPRVWYYPVAGFIFINMIFSFCKMGFLVVAIVVFVYLLYRLFVTYKGHEKRNLITLIVIGSLIVIAGVVFGIPYITKGKVFGKIYELIESITGGGGTLKTRTFIWDNTFQLIDGGWWLLGRGFGVINLMLQPMNMASHHESVFPTHSAMLNMVAEGGIIYLLAYIAFVGYAIYVIVKTYKKNPEVTFVIALGVLAFFIYSIIETIQYLMYVFLFPIFILYYQKVKGPQVEESK